MAYSSRNMSYKSSRGPSMRADISIGLTSFLISNSLWDHSGGSSLYISLIAWITRNVEVYQLPN